MQKHNVPILVIAGVMISFLALTPINDSAEQLLVQIDGKTYLGKVDPQDPKKFRTCDGTILTIEKAELRETDQKCKFERLLVRSDGTTYLGEVDPQDPKKFRTCDGTILTIEKAELRETDQKCKFERLLVRSDGTTYLGEVDPQDPKKFRTCDGTVIAIEKAELRETDQRCNFGGGGGGGACGVFKIPQKPHLHRDLKEEREELEKWCRGRTGSPCCRQLSESRELLFF
jgi:hypothetical protein